MFQMWVACLKAQNIITKIFTINISSSVRILILLLVTCDTENQLRTEVDNSTWFRKQRTGVNLKILSLCSSG